jgi:outer membrane protein assembly factor BamB
MKAPPVRWIWLIGILALTGGCSWFGESRPAKLAAPVPVFTAQTTLRVLWQADLGSSAPDTVLTPAASGNAVFAASKDALMRLENGRELWRIAVPQGIVGGVGASDHVVVVGTGTGEVIAFDPAGGQRMWSAQTRALLLAAPVVSQGVVLVRAGDDTLNGYDAKTGRKLWAFHADSPALTLRIHAEVLPLPGSFLVGLPNGKLLAVNTATGGQLWEGTVALPKGSTELERMVDVASRPAAASGKGCAVAWQGRIACFDFQAGSTLWSKSLSSRAGLDMSANHVFVTDEYDAINAYRVEDGSSLWRNDKLSYRGLTAPRILGDYLVVGDALGVVHLIKRSDGSFAANIALANAPVAATPVLTPTGNILVQTRSGSLYALTVGASGP